MSHDLRSSDPGVTLASLLEPDAFRANLWALLQADRPACRSLRASSREAACLVDQHLLTAARVDMSPSTPSPGAAREQASTAQVVTQEPWQLVAASCGAFLARLPHLAALHVHHWENETAALAPWLLCYSPAGGSLTRLTLTHGDLTAAGAAALMHACPRLQELHLGTDSLRWGADRLAMEGGFFQGLQQPTLTQLSLRHPCHPIPPVLASLAGLSHLRSLTFHTCFISGSCREEVELRPLSRLTNLEHLDLNLDACKPADTTPLFSLTKLTHLQMDGWLPDDAVTRVDGGNLSPAAAAAAAAPRLGDLNRLRSLNFNNEHVTLAAVEDAEFSELRRLTLLTRLAVASILLMPHAGGGAPDGGHLPLLQHLTLSDEIDPTQLLRSLQPLLPLANLETLTFFCFNVSVADAASTPVQAAALRQAAELLAAAPRMRALGVGGGLPSDLWLCGESRRVFWLQPRLLGQSLRPLAHLIGLLTLMQLDLSRGWDEWGELGEALPSLRCLRLQRCTLSGEAMAAIAGGMGSLERLEVDWCRGMTELGWLGMCVARSVELLVAVSDTQKEFTEEVEEECQSRAEALGAPSCRWVWELEGMLHEE